MGSLPMLGSFNPRIGCEPRGANHEGEPFRGFKIFLQLFRDFKISKNICKAEELGRFHL